MSTLAVPVAGTLPDSIPEAAPVDTIRTVLKRDVAAVLRANLPALALVPAEKVYDRVMDDPALLHQAFRLLRARPELFKQLLMTRERALPQRDEDPLWCGRTLAEVVALVVRACARRYFRRHLSGPRVKPAAAPPPPGLLHALAESLGLVEKRRPVRRKGPSLATRAERLYESLRDFLRYEWQVPLIPAYSVLEPATVKALGPKLLDYRNSFQVAVLADHNAAAQIAQGKVPLLLDDHRRLMTGDGINAEVLWTVSQRIHLSHLFPHWDSNESRRALSVVAATTPEALAILAPVVGADIRVFTLFLFTAYGKLEAVGYKQVFGQQGKAWMVRAIADRLKAAPLQAPSMELLKLEMERALDGLVDSALAPAE